MTASIAERRSLKTQRWRGDADTTLLVLEAGSVRWSAAAATQGRPRQASITVVAPRMAGGRFGAAVAHVQLIMRERPTTALQVVASD